jgi:hypothetical protein
MLFVQQYYKWNFTPTPNDFDVGMDIKIYPPTYNRHKEPNFDRFEHEWDPKPPPECLKEYRILKEQWETINWLPLVPDHITHPEYIIKWDTEEDAKRSAPIAIWLQYLYDRWCYDRFHQRVQIAKKYYEYLVANWNTNPKTELQQWLEFAFKKMDRMCELECFSCTIPVCNYVALDFKEIINLPKLLPWKYFYEELPYYKDIKCPYEDLIEQDNRPMMERISYTGGCFLADKNEPFTQLPIAFTKWRNTRHGREEKKMDGDSWGK